jgi:hypothetical protein
MGGLLLLHVLLDEPPGGHGLMEGVEGNLIQLAGKPAQLFDTPPGQDELGSSGLAFVKDCKSSRRSASLPFTRAEA